MWSRSLLLALVLTATLTSVVSAAPVNREQVTARLRAVVQGYSEVVNELDLNRIPGNIPDYPAVSERLDELGGQLEGLSRLAGRENLADADWQQLEEQSAKAEADLKYLRCQSLPLRVWAYFDANEHEKPEWGLAVDKTMCLLPRFKGTFDAEATDELLLEGAAGEQKFAQIIVVPLSKDLREVLVTREQLKGAAGRIPSGEIKVEPLDYSRIPEALPAEPEWWRGRLLLTKASFPSDMTQAYIVTVSIPALQKPGKYSGRIFFAPANSKPMVIRLSVDVISKADEVTK